MIHELQPIQIQELKALSVPKVWNLECHLNNLPSLTPIRGTISAKFNVNTITVKGDIKTIISLSCDRCLGGYNYNLNFQEEELIWIGSKILDKNNLEDHLQQDELMERLDPHSSFDPQRWIFEQLSLRLPFVKLCGADCPGPSKLQKQESSNLFKKDAKESITIDPRWNKLKKLL